MSDLNELPDAEIEKQVQALDAQIADLRAQKKARVQILAARGEAEHQKRMQRSLPGTVITPTGKA